MSIGYLIKKFEDSEPKRKVLHAGKCNGGYILLAPDKELGELNDTSNPIFFISENGNTIERRSPALYPELVADALSEDKRMF